MHFSPSQDFPAFHPSHADESSLLDLLLSPDHSLTSIAARFGTATQSLILWIQRPDIAQRLDASNTALAFRARLAASSCLPSVITALTSILTDFNHKHAATSPATPELLHWRRTETARKSATLLTRLCHFRPPPANATTPQRAAIRPPLPAGGGRGVGKEGAQFAKVPATPKLTTPSAPHSATSSRGHSATPPSPAAPTTSHAATPPPSFAPAASSSADAPSRVSPPPATASLQSEGLAVRSRGVEGGVSPTDTPGKPPFLSQSKGLLVAHVAHPVHQLAEVIANSSLNSMIPDRSSFPSDDAWINHLAQLVGIDPAELDNPNDNLDNTELPESLLANTS